MASTVFDKALGATIKDIIGTVEQDNGVPTGALFQTGSDPNNGEFIRFADGTQLCWKNNIGIGTSGGTSNSFSQTFPIAFITTPSITVSLSGSSNPDGWTVASYLESTTGFTITTFRSNTSGSGSTRADYMAIGRWY